MFFSNIRQSRIMAIFTAIKCWVVLHLPKRLQFLVSDKTAIRARFRKKLGRDLNFEKPKTFNEKLNWSKLYDRNPLMTQCADKYAVREFIQKKIGGRILNELYGVWDNVDEIEFDSLPKSYVLKATHGSGWNIIVKKNSNLNRCEAKRKLKKWLKTNHYNRLSREWVYKNIQPKIICEKYLEDENGQLPDYKFHCFHGNPRLIQVDLDRYTHHKRILYNPEWEKCNFQWGDYPYEKEMTVPPPACLKDMLEISRVLSRGFPFVRIDLYDVKGSPFFSEIGFQPDAGFAKFTPEHWDAEFGKLLELPVKV